MDYQYNWLPGTMVPAELARELSALYSAQYGIWSHRDVPNPGGRIQLAPWRIRKIAVS